MNTPYAIQYFNGKANLFIDTYYDIASNMLGFLNSRQTTLYRVAMAYRDALKMAKVEQPESDYYRLRIPAMERISTRINGGRFVQYRGYEVISGVAFIVDGKKIRVDIHEINFMLSVIVASESTLNTQQSLKKHFKPYTSLSYKSINVGGNMMTFSPYELTISLDPIEGIKPAKSRTEKSAIGRFLMKQLKSVDCFGSQNMTRKTTTIHKNGRVESYNEFYGEKIPIKDNVLKIA